MNKFLKSFVVIITILFLLCPLSFADEANFKEQIKSEDGSMFEKLIAQMIGGIAQSVFDLTTSNTIGIGFKDYDELIFNKGSTNDNLSPFTIELWAKSMTWYKVFATISESFILLATIILAYKIITAGNSTIKKNEAKDSLMRLLFGGILIAFAPLFIKFLLFINNSIVNILVLAANTSLGNILGTSMMTSIKTGNAITTALVISMFIYLFLKLNIKFIIRQFVIIIFTIFTPVAIGLWIINKNATAISIWAGQLFMNIFMQFIYCFLFLMYLAFLPSSGGWAISLIWAMMILPLADTLQNCFQNLTSRIAGMDNDQMSSRALGMGTAIGYSIGAVKEQFKTPNSSNMQGINNNSTSNTPTNTSSSNSFLGRIKNIMNPIQELSPEIDYDGNVNPIRNNLTNKSLNQVNSISSNKIKEKLDNLESSKVGRIANMGVKATTGYLKIGAQMAEGNFNEKHYYKQKPNNIKIQNTQFANNINELKNSTLKGDENEFKK